MFLVMRFMACALPLFPDTAWAWTPPVARALDAPNDALPEALQPFIQDTQDDELASELRSLRHELFNQCATNNTRKRRVTRLLISTGCLAADAVSSGALQASKETESRYAFWNLCLSFVLFILRPHSKKVPKVPESEEQFSQSG